MRLWSIGNQARDLAVAAFIAFVFGIGAVVGVSSLMPAVYAQSAAEDLDAEARTASRGWWGALVAGTPEAVSAVLAPEVQIVRADGTVFDRETYLDGNIPDVEAMPEFSEMTVTRHGDLLVARYFVTVDETRDGVAIQRHAPRLTVFRKEGGVWLVSAHANFARLEQ